MPDVTNHKLITVYRNTFHTVVLINSLLASNFPAGFSCLKGKKAEKGAALLKRLSYPMCAEAVWPPGILTVAGPEAAPAPFSDQAHGEDTFMSVHVFYRLSSDS